jgi:rhamnopyranosyl-N-acetylglucosaminyl-diphospho-decaprenol beta-1,3/1,4-galactofuranosyltransferase
MRVLAVVVTHDRRALLSRCLDGLAAQARPADGVLVVDNGSTDGTREMLDARGVAHADQENLGSAGGWHRGIEEALAGGYDAVWLMDDDGWPEARALEALLQAWRPGVACLSSIVLREDDAQRFVFRFPRLDRDGLPALVGAGVRVGTLRELEVLASEGTYPFVHFFNGALVSLEAVRRIGNIDREYHLFGEEVDFFFRLRAVGEVRSVLAARHRHPDVAARPYSPAKVYYYIRNSIHLHRRYFNHPLLRNLAVPVLALARVARRNGLGDALRYLGGGHGRLFYRALRDGIAGRRGQAAHV